MSDCEVTQSDEIDQFSLIQTYRRGKPLDCGGFQPEGRPHGLPNSLAHE